MPPPPRTTAITDLLQPGTQECREAKTTRGVQDLPGSSVAPIHAAGSQPAGRAVIDDNDDDADNDDGNGAMKG